MLAVAEAHAGRLEVDHVGDDRQLQPSRDRPQRLDTRGVAVDARARTSRPTRGRGRGARDRTPRRACARRAGRGGRSRAARATDRTAERRVVERTSPGRHPAGEVVDSGHAGLGEERGGAARAQAVLADYEDGPAVVRHDRGCSGEPVHRQEQRARHVPPGCERGGRAHVEDAGGRGDELEGLVRAHVLVARGTRDYSGGWGAGATFDRGVRCGRSLGGVSTPGERPRVRARSRTSAAPLTAERAHPEVAGAPRGRRRLAPVLLSLLVFPGLGQLAHRPALARVSRTPGRASSFSSRSAPRLHRDAPADARRPRRRLLDPALPLPPRRRDPPRERLASSPG